MNPPKPSLKDNIILFLLIAAILGSMVWLALTFQVPRPGGVAVLL